MNLDPEAMKAAMEQMKRLGPERMAEMQRQMQANPDLMRQAMAGVKNMSSADVKRAANAMGSMSDDQLKTQMEGMDADKIGQASAQMNAQRSHMYNAALQLKGDGNRLFGAGKYVEAAEKYIRGKQNLEGADDGNSKALQLSCVQNLSACYLKLGKLDKCIAECTLVLERLDTKSIKSFYRRGQAYKDKGQFTEAVADLKRAVELNPADETAKSALEDARSKLVAGGASDGFIITEPEEEEAPAAPAAPAAAAKETAEGDSPLPRSKPAQREEGLVEDEDGDGAAPEEIPAPAAARAPPGGNGVTGASTSGGLPHLDRQKMDEMNRMMSENPDMIKMQAEMLKGMSDEQLKSMAQAGGAPDGFDPAMAKMAADAMASMGPEELKSMMEMAQQMQGAGGMEGLAAGGSPAAALNNPEMMRKMQDPAMMGKAMDMLKNMDPDALVGMSEKMGMKLTKEQAEQMRNMKPEHMQFLVKLMAFLQYVYSLYAEARDFVRARRSVQIALAILLLAFLLRWFGFKV